MIQAEVMLVFPRWRRIVISSYRPLSSHSLVALYCSLHFRPLSDTLLFIFEMQCLALYNSALCTAHCSLSLSALSRPKRRQKGQNKAPIWPAISNWPPQQDDSNTVEANTHTITQVHMHLHNIAHAISNWPPYQETAATLVRLQYRQTRKCTSTHTYHVLYKNTHKNTTHERCN